MACCLAQRDFGRGHGVDAQLDIQIRQGANRELFLALQDDIEAFARHVAVATESIENQARVVEERIRTHAAVLAERHATQEAEYRTIIQHQKNKVSALTSGWHCKPRLRTRNLPPMNNWRKNNNGRG